MEKSCNIDYNKSRGKRFSSPAIPGNVYLPEFLPLGAGLRPPYQYEIF